MYKIIIIDSSKSRIFILYFKLSYAAIDFLMKKQILLVVTCKINYNNKNVNYELIEIIKNNTSKERILL